MAMDLNIVFHESEPPLSKFRLHRVLGGYAEIAADGQYFRDEAHFMDWFERERRHPYFVKECMAFERSNMHESLFEPRKLQLRYLDDKCVQQNMTAEEIKQDIDAAKLVKQLSESASSPSLRAALTGPLTEVCLSLVTGFNLHDSRNGFREQKYIMEPIEGVRYHTVIRVLATAVMHRLSLWGQLGLAVQTYSMTQHWYIRVYEEVSEGSSSSASALRLKQTYGGEEAIDLSKEFKSLWELTDKLAAQSHKP